MMQLKKLFLFSIVILSALSIPRTFGQGEQRYVLQDQEVLKNEISAGLNLHTNGGVIGGVAFKYAHRYNQTHAHAVGLEIVNVKHKKEERFSSPVTGNAFIFGKINYLISLRPQYGHELLLFNKYPEDGVRLSALVMGGPTIGLVKPYYIRFQEDSLITTVAYDPAIHNANRITGSGGFFNGFDEINTEYGFHVKLGLNLEFGRYESTITGIESGWIFEGFQRDILLYPSAQQTQYFNALYLTIYFGSRY